MTNLKCNVENCANYCDHRCCLSMIDVQGPEAENRYDTRCASFVSKIQGVAHSNVNRHDTPNTDLELHCTAVKCVHHCEGDHCDADCVCVGTYSHQSDTMDETQCETFAKPKANNIQQQV